MNNPRGHNIQTPAKRHSALFPTTFGRNLSIPSLLLALSNKLNPASGSRRITIHCPYWIVNASSLPIQLKDGTPQLPTLVPEFQVHPLA